MTDILAAYAAAAAEVVDPHSDAAACCDFARRLTEHAYPGSTAGVPVGLWELYAETGDPWGPVSAVVAAGLADGPVSDTPPLNRWCRVQGWRSAVAVAQVTDGHAPPPGFANTGHTFTAFLDPDGRTARILDSAIGRGPGNHVVDWPSFVSQFRGGVRCVALAGT